MPGVRFSPEPKAKAVRLVAEATPQHESQWAAIESVPATIGASAETVLKWVRRANEILKGGGGFLRVTATLRTGCGVRVLSVSLPR